jgi:hypothetical protein
MGRQTSVPSAKTTAENGDGELEDIIPGPKETLKGCVM